MPFFFFGSKGFLTPLFITIVVAFSSCASLQATAQSVTLDTNEFCFGRPTSFTTSSTSGNYEELAYAVQYPTAQNNANYTCVLSCAVTTGTAYLQGVVTTSGTIPNPTDGTVVTTTDGCTSDLMIELTATQCANLVVVAYCSDGCLGATLNCIESCRSSFGVSSSPQILTAIATKLNNFIHYLASAPGGGGGGGGYRGRRRLGRRNLSKPWKKKKDDYDKHDKYIRARRK